jgi:hypothetical protein
MTKLNVKEVDNGFIIECNNKAHVVNSTPALGRMVRKLVNENPEPPQ